MIFSSERPLRIVILGGGYFAIHAYRSLQRRLKGQLRKRNVRITVIGQNSVHDFHGWTGEVLGGIISAPNRLSALREILPEARIITGEAVSVDLTGQTVAVRIVGTTRIEQVAFDHLMIGTGSKDDLVTVPGLAEHGIPLKGPGEVLALRNHILRTLEQADAVTDNQLRERLLTFVIAGAGFAGVEMCAAIGEFLRRARDHYPVLRKYGCRMVLAHGGDDILPSLRPEFERMADYAAEQLTSYGVWIRRELRLTKVTADGAFFDDGSSVSTATVVSTIGQRRTVLPGTELFARSEDNRIVADAELRVEGWPNVWVGGDVAYHVHPRTGEPCPPNALWAIKHGEHAGLNVARTLLGEPLRPFTYPGLGQAASLGIGKGITELYGMQFTGWLAWAMRIALFEYFMPSRKQAVRVALEWLTLPFLGRHLEAVEPPRRAEIPAPARIEERPARNEVPAGRTVRELTTEPIRWQPGGDAQGSILLNKPQ
jgi:NADH dehydrogenase